MPDENPAALQRELQLQGVPPDDPAQDEVALRGGDRLDPRKRFEQPVQPRPLRLELADHRLDPAGAAQAREARDARRDVDVVGLLELQQLLHQPPREDPVPEPEPGDTCRLAERAQHHEVVVAGDPARAARAIGELDVRLVEHHHRRQREQPRERAVVEPVAGGVVGGGEEHELRPVRLDRGRDRLDIHGEVVAPADVDDLRAREPRVEAVHPERRGRVDHRIPGREEEPAEIVEQLVGAVPDNDVGGGNADERAERIAQRGLSRVGIDVKVRVARERLDHRRQRAVGVLVRVELDDALGGNAEPGAQHLEGLDRRVLLQLRQVRVEQRAKGRRIHRRSGSRQVSGQAFTPDCTRFERGADRNGPIRS